MAVDDGVELAEDDAVLLSVLDADVDAEVETVVLAVVRMQPSKVPATNAESARFSSSIPEAQSAPLK